MRALDERVRDLQADIRTLKAETKLDALREAQAIVNAVQGGLNQRIEALAVKVALVETAARGEVRAAPSLRRLMAAVDGG